MGFSLVLVRNGISELVSLDALFGQKSELCYLELISFCFLLLDLLFLSIMLFTMDDSLYFDSL